MTHCVSCCRPGTLCAVLKMSRLRLQGESFSAFCHLQTNSLNHLKNSTKGYSEPVRHHHSDVQFLEQSYVVIPFHDLLPY